MSKKPESNNSTKDKILQAAEQIFAENGYDGARIDVIAKKAGINKAMLYYYFGSKDNILKEIIEINISKFGEEQENRFNASDLINSEGTINEEKLDFLIDGGLIFMKNYGNVFKILLMELLKGNSRGTVSFEVFNSILGRFVGNIKDNNIEIKDDDEFIMRLFFFNLVPMITFIALDNELKEFYKISPEDLDKNSRNMFKQLFKFMLINYSHKS